MNTLSWYACVSPEFKLRPSLSVLDLLAHVLVVEVSPEFRLRPSFSAAWGEVDGEVVPVSPELRLRPSLNADGGYDTRRRSTMPNLGAASARSHKAAAERPQLCPLVA